MLEFLKMALTNRNITGINLRLTRFTSYDKFMKM